MEIREVTSRRDLDKFIKLPWSIYVDYPNWVPPLLVDVKEFLNRNKHPFYLHGEDTPIGLARLLYRMPRIKTARMAVLVLLTSNIVKFLTKIIGQSTATRCLQVV